MIALAKELAHISEWEFLDLVSHQLSIARGDRKLHGDHVESGRLSSTIWSQKAKDFTFVCTERIPADSHSFRTWIGLADVNSFDLVRLIVILKPRSVFADLGLMIDDILSDVEHLQWGTLCPSTPLVAIADEHINPDIDGADN